MSSRPGGSQKSKASSSKTAHKSTSRVRQGSRKAFFASTTWLSRNRHLKNKTIVSKRIKARIRRKINLPITQRVRIAKPMFTYKLTVPKLVKTELVIKKEVKTEPIEVMEAPAGAEVVNKPVKSELTKLKRYHCVVCNLSYPSENHMENHLCGQMHKTLKTEAEVEADKDSEEVSELVQAAEAQAGANFDSPSSPTSFSEAEIEDLAERVLKCPKKKELPLDIRQMLWKLRPIGAPRCVRIRRYLRTSDGKKVSVTLPKDPPF